jgi:hypothetical protein
MFHDLSQQTKDEILWKLTFADNIISNLEREGYDFNPYHNLTNNNNVLKIIDDNEKDLVIMDFINKEIEINKVNKLNKLNKLNQNDIF